ncbi:transposase [Paenibacillus frigoriresistens]|uniref:transposase n=1 Tax=Paenibacillus alginolyticus TaxID=59839 RepID=UPI001565E33B|nr:transposase [Paenibacillus frigoriresistens]NRF90897.1 transposase [Paenibacillus frigoriresistens]
MKKHSIQNEDQSQVSPGDFGILVPQIESLPMLPSAAKGTASSSKIRYKDFGDLTLADFEVQHLKRTNAPLFHSLMDALSCQGWFERTAHGATPEEQLASFSLFIARAYSLLSWSEHGSAHTLFWQWENNKQQLHSLELQALLCLILQQNTRQTDSDDSSSGTRSYEKIQKKQRPSDRIVNAYDPDLRNGFKSSKLAFTGDKIQVVEFSTSGFIREIEPIPGNEHDGELLKALVTSVITHHEVTPKLVSADSAYGYGHYRKRLKTTARIARNNKEEGYQRFFKTIDYAECPIQAQCTTNKKGRSVFISDHPKLVEAAIIRNETEEGQTARRVRSKIERTNNELANHHELRRPHVRGRFKLHIMAKLKAMVINIKLIIKKLGHYHEDPFVRQKLRPRGIAVCAS